MIEGVRETECVGVVSFVCQLYVMRLGRCTVHIDGQPRLQCKHPCSLFASMTPKRLLRSSLCCHQATCYDACDGNHAARHRYK